jgi:3-deoxy-7-phosphoheptulonate synthase
MLESNLEEGSQTCTVEMSKLTYGVSVTDACISWETTKKLLLCADKRMRSLTQAA